LAIYTRTKHGYVCNKDSSKNANPNHDHLDLKKGIEFEMQILNTL